MLLRVFWEFPRGSSPTDRPFVDTVRVLAVVLLRRCLLLQYPLLHAVRGYEASLDLLTSSADAGRLDHRDDPFPRGDARIFVSHTHSHTCCCCDLDEITVPT